MGLLERVADARAGKTEQRFSIDTWISDYLLPAGGAFGYNGNQYPYGLNLTYASKGIQEVSATLPGYMAALRTCPPAFAAQMVRALVLSQARFTFRNRPWTPTPRRTFSNGALAPLEQPWTNATTGELLSRMEWHAGPAGNAFVTRRSARLRVLRPDWVGIAYGSQREPEDPAHALDGELLGYVYQNGGFNSQHEPETILPDDMAHWSPIPDPENAGIGMSWITPAVRELQADRAVTEHKLVYFQQGATPNLVVKGLPYTQGQEEAFERLVAILEKEHAGLRNAYKCLHPETEVAMWDGRRLLASEVGVGDQVVAWAHGQAVPGTISAVDWQPASPIITVTTQRGRVIKTNAQHPFLLRDGSWIDAIDLNPGDLLTTGLGWATDEIPDALTPYQAWVLGVVIGDGCTISSTPVVSAWDEGIRARLAIGHDLKWTGKGHDYRLLGVRALCVAAGIMGKRSRDKRVPEQVMTGSAKVRAAFLSGLIDTDGHVTDPGLRLSAEIGVTSTSRGLLTDMQHLLASLGINASVSLSMPAGREGGAMRGAGPRRHDAWRLVALGNDQARRLATVLDLANSEKARRLAAYALMPSRQDRSRYDRVVSVEVGPPEPTIGIEVAGHHTHVTGGVVTHNTLYLSAGADAAVVGSNLAELDLKNVQGASETRLSVLSRVPAAILGISEGLAGSTLNAGNFGMARRIFADTWVYPTLQDIAAALAPLLKVPPDAELWFDVGDVPLLREDAKDAAEIMQIQATTIGGLVKEGFTPESSVAATKGQDVTLLKHTGLVSVQLQPPGQAAQPAPNGKAPALPAPKGS